MSGPRVGTRGSALALAQARPVAEALGGELVVVRSEGGADDKGRWVVGLEHALLAGEVDVAVHSAKDVPAELAHGLSLVAALAREDPRDVLVGALPPGGRVGTSSLRRAAQLRAARDDLEVLALRGNVDTRLRKLDEGAWDGIVLAAAGLRRLGVDRGEPLDAVPAAGQGIVVLEARTGEEIGVGGDAEAERALRAERTVVRELGATCRTPLGAHYADGILRTWLGLPDGSAWIADEVRGGDPEALGALGAERLLAAGGRELLEEAERQGAALPEAPASLPEGTPL